MPSNVIITDTFRKSAKKLSKKYKSLANDLRSLVRELESNPYLGDRISKNSYKIRLAIKSKGRGKSGGGRVVTYVNIEIERNLENKDVNVYLLEIYDKSAIENIPQHIIDEYIKDAINLEEE